MRLLFLLPIFVLGITGQNPYTTAGDHYHLVFENAWARATRVTYLPRTTAPVHDHSLTPESIYVYVTDGGEFRFRHMTGMKVAGTVITRPAVKAGAIRVAHSAPETHSVEYLGDEPTEYVRIELRTDPLNAPIRNIRIPPPVLAAGKPTVLNEYENDQVRILRVLCGAGVECPVTRNADDPAIVTVMSGPERGKVRWVPAGLGKAERGPLDEVRIELKTEPVAGPHTGFPLRADE